MFIVSRSVSGSGCKLLLPISSVSLVLRTSLVHKCGADLLILERNLLIWLYIMDKEMVAQASQRALPAGSL